MTKQEIHKICDELNIYNYTINKDMSIDVNGHIIIPGIKKDIKHLPLQFNLVTKTFDCGFLSLISLKGSPKFCSGYACSDNSDLESLDYATLNCDIDHGEVNYHGNITNNTNVSPKESDRYLLRRIFMGDYESIKYLITETVIKKAKILKTMRDFDLL